MQAQPPYPPDYWYSRAVDWPKKQMMQFIDTVVARDPVHGAKLSSSTASGSGLNR